MLLFDFPKHVLIKLGLFSTMLFAFGDVQAQLKYGLLASGDWNSYLFVEDIGVVEQKGKLNFSIGGILESAINDRLSVSAGVNYATKNHKEEIDLNKYRFIGDDLINYEIIERTYTQSFIELPLSLKYKIKENERCYFYPTLGIIAAKRIKYGVRSSKGSADSLGLDSGKYNDFLLSTKIGFGIFFKKEKIGIGLEPNVRFYINKVHLYDPKKNPVHIGVNIYILKI